MGGKQRGEELAACSAAVEKQTKEVEKWGREEQSCLANEGALEQTVSSCRNRVGELQRAVQAASSQGAQMKALMEAKRSGSIPGIYGRLGDLGVIDGKYDIAISTACPALEYVVVQSAEDAQAGVEMLRKSNLGVATFLILVGVGGWGGGLEVKWGYNEVQALGNGAGICYWGCYFNSSVGTKAGLSFQKGDSFAQK